MAVSGTWLGLPDFGITEALGIGTPNPNFAPSIGPDSSMMSVPGVTPYAYSAPISSGGLPQISPITPTNTTTYSGGGGGTSQPVQQPSQQDPNASLLAEIDNIYNQTMGLADQKRSQAESQKSSMEGDVMAQYGGNVKALETSKGQGEREIAGAETTAGQTKDNALAAGRRLSNELQMGGQQRFGGASSAGQAYSELTGREFQRGQAQTYQAFQNAMTKVMDMKSNLQERFDSSLNNLMIQKDSAISEVRRWFQDKLGEIDALRAEAGVNKSTQRLELLQNLRNQVYQINLSATQTQAQLAQKLQAQQAELDKYTQLLGSNSTALGQNQQQLASVATSNPQSSLAMSTNNIGPTQQYTGRIKEDEITGISTPFRKDQMFA